MSKLFKLALSTLLALSLVACSGNSANQESDKQENTSQESGYKAGTYVGVAEGINGDIKVEVTFDESTIKTVTVLEHKETDGLSTPAFTQIPEDVVTYQSLGVDGIAGASATSNGVIEAIAACVEQAGGDVEALKNVPVEKEETTELVSKQADVIVVGGGSAGLSSAVSAAQNGSSVVLIEANAYLGGNTVRTGGAMIVSDPENMPSDPMTKAHFMEIEKALSIEIKDPVAKAWQDKVREDVVPYMTGEKVGLYDSVEFTSLQYYLNNYQRPIPERIYEMFDQSLEVKAWMADMDLTWTDTPSVLVGHGWPRTYYSTEHKAGNAYVDIFVDQIEAKDLDVEIITGVRGEDLIVEEDRVVGVTGTSLKGQPYELKANKGVIIATGGFSANPELLEKHSDGYFPNIEELRTDNDPSCVGDGIIMAEEVGAQFFDMGHVQVLPITDPVDGSTKTFAGSTTGLYVNKEGVRFVNEAADRDTMSSAILEQTDQEYYVISSEANNGIDDNGLNMMGIELERLLETGKVIKADTLEELAKKINMDPTVLKDTVEKFNEAVKTGYDSEFGRVSFQADMINPGVTLEITEGPYYACLRAPAVHITKGGILIDGDSRVLGTEGTPIKGLFAAGEVTGGIAVNGIGHSLHTGKIAGETVSAE